jgi:regulation of enolase protein 1 (concanavalin A-like superfamily)
MMGFSVSIKKFISEVLIEKKGFINFSRHINNCSINFSIVTLSARKSILWVCLDHAKNSVRIEELRIVREDSEKIVIFRLAQG